MNRFLVFLFVLVAITFVPHFAFSGRTYAISYEITGTIGSRSHSVTITQDDISQLRQEYVDLGKAYLPTRDQFELLETKSIYLIYKT